jgi:single-strand selective monofunctional uracil DNA glycosylase
VKGFACCRNEVSGSRLWGWARDRFATPERFFERFYVHNYCPLCFMEESGRNRTPDKLPKHEREPLFGACDRALQRVADHFKPDRAIAVGKFAEDRLRSALDGKCVEIGRIPHPSPANPNANKNWAGATESALRDIGVELG